MSQPMKRIDLDEVAHYEAPSGVVLVEHRDDEGQPQLELRAPDGALVLEYKPTEGLCRIHAPRVEVAAQSDLRLSGRRVAIEADEKLALRSGALAY